MQQHIDHKNAADDLAQKASAAGLTALADAARAHSSASVAASQAHATGDDIQKAQATGHLLDTLKGVLSHVSDAAQHPEVLAAGKHVVKTAGEGIAASV